MMHAYRTYTELPIALLFACSVWVIACDLLLAPCYGRSLVTSICVHRINMLPRTLANFTCRKSLWTGCCVELHGKQSGAEWAHGRFHHQTFPSQASVPINSLLTKIGLLQEMDLQVLT
jgi:hypothetical protein